MCSEDWFRFHAPFFEFAGFGLGRGFPFHRFAGRSSYPFWLEAYKTDLEEELKAVTDEIEKLKRKNAA